mmetsp:Transcript_14654/g.21569  ORF Transcript_14654/g.21569 Transcript_14654/m.21569 type:complete len:84 (+) Transcript_14654:33-284(+)
MASSNSVIGDQEEECFDSLFEISNLLNTGLDRESLQIIIKLCSIGANPTALATVVKELRQEGSNQKSQKNPTRTGGRESVNSS